MNHVQDNVFDGSADWLLENNRTIIDFMKQDVYGSYDVYMKPIDTDIAFILEIRKYHTM